MNRFDRNPNAPVDFEEPSMPTVGAVGDAGAIGRIDHYDILRKLGG